jgi:hypothetical protein
MTIRDPAVQTFVSATRDAFAAREVSPDVAAAIGRMHAALRSPGGAEHGQGRRLPVCTALSVAFANARRHSPVIARIVDAFEAIEPALSWAPRSSGGAHASGNWPEGHANAIIIGPGGVESRDDVWIGVSLLAPHVRYPDHNHAPAEVYLVLSPGRFRHGASGWFEPGIGGTLYNQPNITHAMASDAAPLLAVWHFWTGRPAFA